MPAIQDPEVKAALLRRLKRIEGQSRGVARMIESDRDCQEIIQQLMAIRAAVYQASMQLVRSFTFDCIRDPDGSPEEMVETLIRTLSRIP